MTSLTHVCGKARANSCTDDEFLHAKLVDIGSVTPSAWAAQWFKSSFVFFKRAEEAEMQALRHTPWEDLHQRSPGRRRRHLYGTAPLRARQRADHGAGMTGTDEEKEKILSKNARAYRGLS